jgi:hypothetical protein
MNISSKPHRQTLVTILVFLGCLGVFSAFAHFAIVRLAPVSIYVGALMISPALAAALTLKLRGRRVTGMPWKWGSWSANIKSYLIPVAYVSAAYGLIWLLGLGTPGDPDTIAAWQDELGLGGQPAGLAIALMIALLATVQFIKSVGADFWSGSCGRLPPSRPRVSSAARSGRSGTTRSSSPMAAATRSSSWPVSH